MNETRWLGLGFCLLFAGMSRGQEPTVLYTASVVVNEVEVRSGPGGTAQLYPTNILRKGDKVEVVKEVDGGWLAIKPPPSSFSWINARFVNQIVPGRPIFAVVAAPDTKVPILMGSNIRTDKPTIEGVKVMRGAQLTAIGPMRKENDGGWLPVMPPPLEVRYIKAEAVSKKPGETVAVGNPPSPPGIVPVTPPGMVPPPPELQVAKPPTVAADGTHPLWVQAQQAEKEGKYNEAIQIYRQLGGEVANTNHNLSVQAYNRAQWIADALQGRPGTQGTLTNRIAASPSTAPAGTVSSGPGVLRRAGRSAGLDVMYVLENSKGLPVLYAVPQPGYTLAPYENRNVELYGSRQWRADQRAYFMTVVQVRPLQ